MRVEISQDLVRELLHYDPETGALTWRERDRKHFKTNRGHSIWNSQHAGKPAGGICRRKDGYSYHQLGIFNGKYLANRIIWIYMVGNPVPTALDHKNRDATDNRWCNIKASDAQENMLNRSRDTRNTSGHTGVSWHSIGKKWRAACTVRGASHFLGLFDDKADAAHAVREFRKANGFTEGHGELRPY